MLKKITAVLIAVIMALQVMSVGVFAVGDSGEGTAPESTGNLVKLSLGNAVASKEAWDGPLDVPVYASDFPGCDSGKFYISYSKDEFEFLSVYVNENVFGNASVEYIDDFSNGIVTVTFDSAVQAGSGLFITACFAMKDDVGAGEKDFSLSADKDAFTKTNAVTGVSEPLLFVFDRANSGTVALYDPDADITDITVLHEPDAKAEPLDFDNFSGLVFGVTKGDITFTVDFGNSFRNITRGYYTNICFESYNPETNKLGYILETDDFEVSFEAAFAAEQFSIDGTVDVSLTPSRRAVYAVFTAPEEGMYFFTSYDNENTDPLAYLYDTSFSQLTMEDDNADNRNYRIEHYFSAGECCLFNLTSYFSGEGAYKVSCAKAPYPTKVEITRLPQKLSYIEDEAIDYTGLYGSVTFSDGREDWWDNNTESIRYYPLNIEQDGATVTVSFGSAESSFRLELHENPVDSIVITKAPDKTTYNTLMTGYTIPNLDGMEVTVYMKDGTNGVVNFSGAWMPDYLDKPFSIQCYQRANPTLARPAYYDSFTLTYMNRSVSYEGLILDYPALSVDTPLVVESSIGYSSPTYTFTPAESGDYAFVLGDYQDGTITYIFDSNNNYISFYDSGFRGKNGMYDLKTATLDAGVTYYIVCSAEYGVFDAGNTLTVSKLRTVSSVEILHTPSITEYLSGTEDDVVYIAGLSYRVSYTDGTNQICTYENDNQRFFPNFSEERIERARGADVLTVTVGDISAEVALSVIDDPIEAISVEKLPDKVDYYINDYILDVTGLDIKLSLKDGTTKTAVFSENVSSVILDGYQLVLTSYINQLTMTVEYTVYYRGHTASFTVRLHNETLQNEGAATSVVIDKSYSIKTFEFVATQTGRYIFYSTADGIYPYCTLYDADNRQLASDGGYYRNFRLSYNLEAGKTYYLDVHLYYSQTGTFDMFWKYVYPLTSLEITHAPRTSTYIEGLECEEFDFHDLEVTFTYSNGTTFVWTYGMESKIDDNYLLLSYNNQNKTVTIVYDTFRDSYNLTAVPNPVDHLAVTKAPYKTEYDVFISDSFTESDMTGMEVTVYYTDGTTKVVEADRYYMPSLDNYAFEYYMRTEPSQDTDTLHQKIELIYMNKSCEYTGLTVKLHSLEEYKTTPVLLESIDGEGMCYSFTPTVSGKYIFSMSSSYYNEITGFCIGTLYHDNVKVNSDSQQSSWETLSLLDLTYTLTAGETYYFSINKLDGVQSHNLDLLVGQKKTVTGFEVSRLPDKNQYIIGVEDFKVYGDGLELNFTFSDGTTALWRYNDGPRFNFENVYLTHEHENGRIRINYCDFVEYFDCESIPDPINSILIESLPAKTDYIADDFHFDSDGLTVKINYTNGMSELVSFHGDGQMVAELNGYTVEILPDYFTYSQRSTLVKVCYRGHEASFIVHLSMIKLTDDGTVISGEIFSDVTERLFEFTPTVNAEYTFTSHEDNDTYGRLLDSDMTTELSSNDDGGECNNFSMTESLEAGKTYYLEARYYSRQSGLMINVSCQRVYKIVSIEITTPPSKTEYVEGMLTENMDYSGLSATLTADNGKTILWRLGDSTYIEGGNLWYSVSNNCVVVNYGELSDSYELTIIPNPVEYIHIDRAPDRTSYNNGDSDFYGISLFGMVLTIDYTDGTSKEYMSKSTNSSDNYDGYSISTSYEGSLNDDGEHTITVSYLGKSDSFTINCYPAGVDSLVIERIPYVTEALLFTSCENLYHGLQIRINYDDGTSALYDYDSNAYRFDGYNVSFITDYSMLQLGENKICVRYMNKETSFVLTGLSDGRELITGIEVTKNPDCLYRGNDIDFLGMELTLHMSEGDDKIIRFTEDGEERPFVNANVGYEIKDSGDDYVTLHIMYLNFSTTVTFDYTPSPVESISIIQMPRRPVISLDSQFSYSYSFDGLEAEIEYTDGRKGTYSYSIDGDFFEGYRVEIDMPSNISVGDNVIHLEYLGAETSFVMTGADNIVDSVEIIRLPDKTNYCLCSMYKTSDLDGARFKVTYHNGTVEQFDYSEKRSSFYAYVPNFNFSALDKKGVYAVHGTYNGCSFSYDISVGDSIVESLRIVCPPTKSEYYYNGYALSSINYEGMVLEVTYTDGTVQTLSDTNYFTDDNGYRATVSTSNQCVYGENTALVTFLDKQTYFRYNFNPSQAESISVVKPASNNNLIYQLNSYSITGLVVKVVYKDGSEALLNDANHFTDRDCSLNYNTNYQTVGTNYVRLSFMGVFTSTEYTVIENPVESISMEKLPDKLTYSYNGTDSTDINISGMELRINYKDGTSEVAAYTGDNKTWYTYNDFNVSCLSYTTHIGENTVTIEYLNKRTSYIITVNESPVDHIAIVSAPTKVYYENDRDSHLGSDYYMPEMYCVNNYDALRGLVFDIYFKDNTIKRVTGEELYRNSYYIDDYSAYFSTDEDYSNRWTQGEHTVTLSYLGVSTDYSIRIVASPVESITVLTPPTLTEYANSFTPVMDGLSVRINYTDETNNVVSFDDSSFNYVAGYVKDSVFCRSLHNGSNFYFIENENTVTIEYIGKSVEVPITKSKVYNIASITGESPCTDGNLTNLRLTLTYNDGSTETLDSKLIHIEYFYGSQYLKSGEGKLVTAKGIIYFEIECILSQLGDFEFYHLSMLNKNFDVFPESTTPGDINGDSFVNGKDYLTLRTYLVDGNAPGFVISAADVNGDMKVNIKDAIILSRYLAGWQIELV